MLEVYIDGASAGNPGLSGAGIFIKYDGKTEQYKIPLGMMDNHEAEFAALIKALEICQQHKADIISIRTDSQAVERALDKRFAKNEKYNVYLQQALQLVDEYSYWFVKWIPSKENQVADQLARSAIKDN
ncbi:reverse transcriptase-like protein [Bacillus sp. HMF5848]|uniref:reverse transcriptase-like protein n=1 Tax=Bacillus sp. HMF5848 TaxID=2495421 RepID=UPI000F78A3F2|nr:reverse transcriptase-like protein [Bacillus sp. HMF5848]RSK27323.1 reverse transcriptase-like protein [Bacillus sp. HMF5848]